MKNLTLIFLSFFLLACGSRKVDKQKSKEFSKVELSETKHEKVEEIELSKKEVETNIQEYDFSIFENFNLIYEGVNLDDYVLIEKTDKGIKMSGSGKADLGQNKGTNDKRKATNQNKVDSAVKAKKSENNEQNNLSANSKKEGLDKKTERKNNSGWYWVLGLFGAIALIIIGLFIYRRLKKL